jgi:hypothetical protein
MDSILDLIVLLFWFIVPFAVVGLGMTEQDGHHKLGNDHTNRKD